MTNRQVEFAWKYHNATKHSWNSVRTDPHFLDWSNRPRLFKMYRGLEGLPLPRDLDGTGRPALAVTRTGTAASNETAISLGDLASILYFSAGITRRRPYPDGEFLFRAAACTGALYAIELYAVCKDLQGLEAGVYLFNPAEFVLTRIRTGDYRGVLAAATAGEPGVLHAPLTIICTGTYWRNAWKYQARTYRHFGWDNGTILANLLAIATARNLPAKVVNGFVDAEVNQLLGLNTQREVALNLVPLGFSSTPAPEFTAEIPRLELVEIPYSRHETDYSAMHEIHTASSLTTSDEVAAWRGNTLSKPEPPASSDWVALDAYSDAEMPQDSIEAVIQRRGSSRRFVRTASISFRELSTALYRSTQGVAADFLDQAGSQLNDLYLVCHAVDGLKPGAYLLHRNPWALELLKPGEFRKEAGYLGLEQSLPADCSAAIFFLADLDKIFERYGNRGYRATQLEAGTIGGRLYLAAYAQRLGATGLTFYDDDVTRFFSPHAERKSAIFLVALGKTAKNIQGL